jgi:hypothetical protein
MPPLDRLEVISPTGEITFYELNPAHGVTNIGRHPDNDVVIDSPSVAPFHAVLYHQQRPYQLIFIGEAQGRAQTLEQWDTLQLDGFALVLLEGEPAGLPAAGAAKPAPEIAASATALGLPRAPAPAEPALRRSDIPQSSPAAVLIPNRRDEVVLAEFSAREFTLEVEQTATCTVALANGGDIVATFVITVPGLDDRWVSITPAEINLNEGQHGTAIVTLTPPRKPSSHAGVHHFGVVVSSPDYPDRVSQTSATLVIQPYFEYGISDISPKQQNIPYGRRAGSAAFSLTNTGNSEVKFQVQAADDARACQFEFQVHEAEAPQARQIEVSVPPEATQTVKLTLAPLKRLFFGIQGVPHAYSVQATPLGTSLSPRSVLGQAQSLPLIGPIHVAVLLVLLALLAIVVFRPRINAFAATPDKVLSSEIMAGKKVSLSWNVSWLTAVTIDQGVGQMKGNVGATDIAPVKTLTYRLTATNLVSALIPAFAATREQTVVVDPVEPIVRLAVDKDKVLEGETVTLSWEVLNAKEVVLKINGTPETLPPEQYIGRREVTPKGEVIYSLEARNLYTTGAGIVQTRVVNAAKPTPTPLPLPIIQMFTVPPGPVVAGDTVTLEWSVVGVDKVTIEPLGEFPPSGKTIDKPSKTTSYQLVASNGQDEVRSLRELVVNPPPTATPVPGTPKIDVLTATPGEVALGSPDITNIQLTWAVSGDYTTIELSGDTIGRVSGLAPRGTRIVSASNKDTDFVLTARNGSLEAAQSITIKVVVPVPVVSNLSPPSAVAGGTSSLVLTVNGANFVDGATVRWDGSDRPTVFVSNAVLRADIPASDIGTRGKFAVTVFNPAKSGGGASSAITFMVNNPVPILTDLDTYTATVGIGTDLAIGLIGSGFMPDSRALWGGLPLDTTYGDQNNLTAIIPAARTMKPGDYIISVNNAGSGSSAGKIFTVGNPVPKIVSVTPGSQPVQPSPYADVVLDIKGAGFQSDSNVSWNGNLSATVQYQSSTELLLTVPASYFGAVGRVALAVINPAPLGGPSTAWSFNVTKIPTTVVLTTDYPSAGAVSGQPVTLFATVSYAGGIATLPAGTVTFMNTGAVLDVANVSNRTATLTRPLAAGSLSLQAIYNGDTYFDTGTSVAVPYIVNPATPMVAINQSSASTYGQSAQFVAKVTALSPGSDSPVVPCGGALQFFINGNPLGTPVAYCGGYVGSPTISTLNAGTYAVTAQYNHVYGTSVDTHFLDSAVSAAMVHQVVPLSPTVSISANPSPASSYGAPITLNATLSSTAGVPTSGNVVFTVQSTGAVLGSGALAAGQTSIIASALLNVGTYTLQATFTSTDPNFNGASGTVAQKINPIPPGNITLSCNRNFLWTWVDATVTVDPPASPAGMSIPSGRIVFSYSGITNGTTPIGLPGTMPNNAVWTVDNITAINVSAIYEPDTASNYVGGQATPTTCYIRPWP